MPGDVDCLQGHGGRSAIDGAGSRDFPQASHHVSARHRRRQQTAQVHAGAGHVRAAGAGESPSLPLRRDEISNETNGPSLTAGFRVPVPAGEGLQGLMIFSPDSSTQRAAVSLSRPNSAGGATALFRLISRVSWLLRSEGLSLQHNIPLEYVDAQSNDGADEGARGGGEETESRMDMEENEQSAQYVAGMLRSLFANDADSRERPREGESLPPSRGQVGGLPRAPTANFRRRGIIPYRSNRWRLGEGADEDAEAGRANSRAAVRHARAYQDGRRRLPLAPSSYYRQRSEPHLIRAEAAGAAGAAGDGGEVGAGMSVHDDSTEEDLDYQMEGCGEDERGSNGP